MAETDINAGSSLPTNYSDNVAGIETHGSADPNTARNPHSTALGKHQFIDGTWMAFARANPGLFQGMTDQQILDKRSDSNYSKLGTDWYARYNAGILQQHGIAPTAANLGLAHGFGGIGAVGILSQPDSMKLSDALTATQGQDAATRIMAANPGYLNLSVGDIKGRYAGFDQTGTAPVAVASTAPATPAPVTPPAATASVNPQLAQLQKLALLNRLMPTQPTQQTALNATGPYGWGNALLNTQRVTPENPLQTIQQIAALRALQGNNGSLLG